MTEKTTVHIGENSPEKVALDLFEKVASVENKVFYSHAEGRSKAADRKWILDTYAECLTTVRGWRKGKWDETQ